MYSRLSVNVFRRYMPQLPTPVLACKFCGAQELLNKSGVPDVGEFHGCASVIWLTKGHVSITSIIKMQTQSPMKSMSKYTVDWKAEFIMWMDPAQPPMKEQLAVHRETIMNGLFLTSHYTGYSMGMNYEGTSTIGYSMEKKKY